MYDFLSSLNFLLIIKKKTKILVLRYKIKLLLSFILPTISVNNNHIGYCPPPHNELKPAKNFYYNNVYFLLLMFFFC